MLYFIVLTQVCNLHCIYCGNAPDPSIEPVDITYTINDLKSFLSSDPDASIAFYGGEPLLRMELMKKIMDEVDAKRFILQTNGLLLKKLDTEYLKRFDTILVSIDGREKVNDYYRGRGTYRRIIDNIRDIRERGFNGDLIARMAVSSKTDIFEDVRHLLSVGDPWFDHVHWQLDVMWDHPPYQRYKNFDEWLDRYNAGISKLVNYWLEVMRTRGEVLGIVPFLGIMKTFLFNEKAELRCGAGINAFTITTSGKLLACPIAPEFEWNRLGDIYHNKPLDIVRKVTVGEPCTSCEIREICGGRCLFANKTKLWGMNGFRKICGTVKHLVWELQRAREEIEKLIDAGTVEEEDFNYPKYNNTTEIIP